MVASVRTYRTVYADPPWYEAGGGRIRRGANRHYPLMKTREIKLLDVPSIAAPDAHLYLWVTNNFLRDGLEVMAQWGFRYITNLAWIKDRFGLGQYFRGQHELLLFGVRGRLPAMNGRRISTVIHAPRREHSRKPEEVYRIIELSSPLPRVELFARDTHAGWDSWGNEVDSHVNQERLWHVLGGTLPSTYARPYGSFFP